jgi:hypothetical protein
MRGFVVSRALLAVLLFGGVSAVARAEPRVELELLTEPGTPVTGSHQWLAELRDVGLSGVRIRAAKPGDREELKQRGSDASPVYQVTGLLTTRNTLRVPGGEFRMTDKAGLKQWLAKLQEGGEGGLFEKSGEFGLTARQLVSVHEALSKPVLFSTKGERSFDMMKRVAGGLATSLWPTSCRA